MFKESEKEFSFETELLKQGAYIRELAANPETAPIYLTTAFNVEDLDDLQARYDVKGFCYNRNRNPNRSTLIELMTYLEKGENSIICSSGMAAISTAVLSIVKQGDHILSDQTLYGETIDIFSKVLSGYGVDVTYVDFTDLDQVKAAVKENTKILYTETVSNPMITVVDIDAVADIAHANDAVLIVDNTFMTPVAFRPIEHGADLTVNSLTKFANGHSDAVCGALTGRADLIQKAYNLQVLLGTSADAFTSWLVQRGMRTMSLRVEKQMSNAAKLAKALEESPYVLKVNHPSLESHPQHELAKNLFKDTYGGMLSFVLPDNKEKINKFMRKLNLAHYAMTLGGYRTTISHPVMSSHYDIPEEERLKMGITYGLLRISVGIENADDLVEDFLQALEAFAE
ncbi:cystathionine beta-lyase MetC [Clostridium pasteurianum DSM 525 = ATCC 6013]|uniref:homocysteine desulfhydrase n=1 Tax=Clostridium pasteurianum DSM 525 = ATCC 6013 TaxID=1262449 RepID=A0A0H3J1L4_CLOPA|nr:aminotransferase class I/II-fold pyridoxal phosphate-dependent enzyme [Clostridium pasteurianum]AJA47289.1 cystathionine beta-lyase MetC [Clostridium pasteurianum DSM 525 = ATCC 6013]AJA51277.1 cystathionine beta-lyase MetC [Clostridium pasteurianum DSM 525 = ATCC 6013]AOZ74630.1 cystathionine beta-lyase [Clostridium pasteurianum DSM 525 = ATCC 6013]AOZ78427.1 cystathionine beta-lyase [Clostridium pasteurianum]ELP57512.1 cystathionine beta-lyase [Clostridium pasteurianum DSM 525 = ATCC 6013